MLGSYTRVFTVPNELNIIHGWVQSEQDQKIKEQIGYQWDNSLNFYLKTNIEGELISEIGNEFQILGPW